MNCCRLASLSHTSSIDSRERVQHRRDGPYRKAFSGDAATLQDAPFFRIELLQLDLQHLLQRLRDAGIDLLDGRGQNQSAPILRNQALVHHVLHDRHHEERVASRVSVNQVRKTRGKTLSGKVLRQVVRDVGLFETFDGNFMTQVADQQILLQGLERALGKNDIYGAVCAEQGAPSLALCGARMRRSGPASKDRPNEDLPESRATAFAPRCFRESRIFRAPCALACFPESLAGETLFVRASPVREIESTRWALAWPASR